MRAARLRRAARRTTATSIIAGFGRVGQIVARILRAKRIPFTALDISAEQVDFVRKFGAQVFYGDASRPEILEAAQTDKARAFVLAIDDVEASLRTAELVRQRYPHVPIYARARNRNHAHRLMDLGVTGHPARDVPLLARHHPAAAAGLGSPSARRARMIQTFRTHDERRLIEDYKLASDVEKLRERARSDVKTLEKLFEEDAAEEERLREVAQSEEVVPVKPIICVGHAALDYVYRIEAFPPQPTKVRSLEHIESGGGMAANAAATIARLGGEVELWSRIGDDSAGAAHSTGSSRPTASIRSYVRTFEQGALVDLGGHRRRRRRAADRRRARPRHADGRELAAARARRRGRGGAQRPALARGHARGFSRGARARACRRCSMPISAAREAVLAEILALTDYAIFSGPRSTSSRPTWTAACPARERAGAGRRATPASRAGRDGYTWLSKSGSSRPPAGFAAEVVDTTGAGDAFHGAFAWALAEGRPAAECARIAAPSRRSNAAGWAPAPACQPAPSSSEFLAARVD